MHFRPLYTPLWLLASLAGSAIAAPRPQSYDFAALLDQEPDVTAIEIPATATATSIVIDSTSIQAAIAAAVTDIAQDINDDTTASGGITRRQTTCAVVSTGYGTAPTTNTPEAFLASPDLTGASSSTAVPSGYTNVYTGAKGELPAYGWYALKTLKTYSVQDCANYCSSFTACSSFNIFYERLPQQDPVCNPDTPAVAQIKCVAHGWNPVSAADATNVGQWRGKFKVVVSGAAAYTQTYSTAPVIAGYTAPKTLADGKCAINAPLDPEFKGVDGKYIDTYMGTKLFTNTPFDPSLCTKLCQDTTQFDSKNIPAAANGLYKTCNYVNVFMLNKNAQSQGMQCSMYSRSWKDQEDALAVNCGYTDTRWNDKYTITRSTSYAVSNFDRVKSRTDIRATPFTMTFDESSLVQPDSVVQYNFTRVKELLVEPIYGFAPTNDASDGAKYYAFGIYRKNPPDYVQPSSFGEFGTCDYLGGCTLHAQGFTFDLVSLNYGDLMKARGSFYLEGYRNGKLVASLTPKLRSGDTLSKGVTGNLGSQWYNLDAVSFDSQTWPVFDNIAIVKYSTGPASGSTKSVKRDIDPAAVSEPKLDTTPASDAQTDSADAEGDFKPLYHSSGVFADYKIDQGVADDTTVSA